MMKRKIIICTGGRLGDWALSEIGSQDMVVGADRGALFLIQHGVKPYLSIGDFDSVTETEKQIIRENSIQMTDCDPVYKDLTDTEMAFRWATQQKPDEIVLIGALGSRLDHTLANVHLLSEGLKLGVLCKIVDQHNEVSIVNDKIIIHKSRFAYVSLLPLSMEVHGITLTGFQYPLNHASLSIGQSLGISNKLSNSTGEITVKDGLLLVIQSVDE